MSAELWHLMEALAVRVEALEGQLQEMKRREVLNRLHIGSRQRRYTARRLILQRIARNLEGSGAAKARAIARMLSGTSVPSEAAADVAALLADEECPRSWKGIHRVLMQEHGDGDPQHPQLVVRTWANP